MQWTEAGEAFTALILEIFRLNGRLLSAGDALTRPVGQTSARWQVLGALGTETRTVADIARRMGLTRQSVQRVADLLEADGLVSYAMNPAHQRAKLAMLTRRGRAALREIMMRQIEWANRVASRFTEEDLEHATAMLEAVRGALGASPASPGRKQKPPGSGHVPRPVRRGSGRRRRS